MSTAKALCVSYDEIGDVLYVSTVKNARTDNEEVEDGLYLRYDSDTHSPVGATVIDYKEYWAAHRGRLEKCLAKFFGISAKQTAAAIRSAL